MHIVHNARSIFLLGTLLSNPVRIPSRSTQHSWEALSFRYPFLVQITPHPRKATPTFPTLCQAHKRLPKEDSFHKSLQHAISLSSAPSLPCF